MSHEGNLSFLEAKEFGLLFFPRRDPNPRPGVPEVTDHLVEVEPGVQVGCRFYVAGPDCPSLLYFHGNVEIVGDHDWLAPLYTRRGINLFVADYRGYGFSGGEPSFSAMIRDAHPILESFEQVLAQRGYCQEAFVMGRSLGSIPALELAFHYQDQLQGLIVESGSANTFPRLARFVGLRVEEEVLEKMRAISNKAKISSVRIPTLIIHAEQDEIVPLEEGMELYASSGAQNKKLLVIPRAGHNDLMVVGQKTYFETIEGFVKSHGG